MAGRLSVGTSGFAYEEWRHGVFYPEGLPPGRMLEHYASVLDAVEINYTFRKLPSEDTMRAWREQTPDGFVFALKANQRITHVRKLAGVRGEIETFAQRASLLGDRLGPVLFQTPPTLPYDAELFDGFVAALPDGMAAAMECRHPSWSEVRDVVTARGIAWCVADTDEEPVEPRGPIPDSPFVYLRLRRTVYADDDLAAWAERIRSLVDGGADVHCFFKHEDSGTGPRWAARVLALVHS